MITSADASALLLLAEDPPVLGWTIWKCAMFGAALWPNRHRKPQDFARPAGKVNKKENEWRFIFATKMLRMLR